MSSNVVCNPDGRDDAGPSFSTFAFFDADGLFMLLFFPLVMRGSGGSGPFGAIGARTLLVFNTPEACLVCILVSLAIGPLVFGCGCRRAGFFVCGFAIFQILRLSPSDSAMCDERKENHLEDCPELVDDIDRDDEDDEPPFGSHPL